MARLTWLRNMHGGDDNCPNNDICPSLRLADTGALIVQGYQTARPGVVRVPAVMLPEWDSPERRHGDGELLISGQPVTDRELLAEIDIPEGEAVIAVAPAGWPALAGV